MKKRILIPAMLLASLAMASDYKYEISPMIGYNIAEGNLGIDNNGYLTGGLEFQINSENSKISPEVSIYYAPGVDYSVKGDTDIFRGAFNAVYTYDETDMFTPFAKIGGGLEKLSDNKAGNGNRFFFDTGVGAKMDLTESLALKLEAIYMLKPETIHAGNADSNLMTLVGLTYSFGGTQAKIIVEEPTLEADPVVVVPVDSDKDGVVDGDDKCPNTALNSNVDASGCVIVLDTDNDGVIDANDMCPNTLADTQVDEKGCKLDLDDDQDGVLNSKDICPNTPLNSAVDTNGCPQSVALDIKFENNSYKVKEESFPNLDKYAKFLKTYTNYSAKIVGYTDSVGSAAYNQKLSEKRANEVVNMLKERGVDASQLSAKGMGEADPIADNATEEGRAQNRRIEVELIKN